MFKYLTVAATVLLMNPAYAYLATPILQTKTTQVETNKTVQDNPLDVSMIEINTGIKPVQDNQTQTYKISSLRTDLQNQSGLKGIKLLSWAEFKKDGQTIQLEGKLVVTRNQINPLIALLLKNNLNVVGLHDHLGNEYPSILYLQFEGKGNEKDLSQAVAKAFALLKQGGKSEEFPLAILDVESTTLNTALIDHLMKSSGKMQDGGIYQVASKNTSHKAAHAKSDINFSGTNDSAMVEGDLVLNQDSLKKILPVLAQAGISIISIKEALPVKEDKVVEIHYYGIGKAANLARGLHNALNVSEN